MLPFCVLKKKVKYIQFLIEDGKRKVYILRIGFFYKKILNKIQNLTQVKTSIDKSTFKMIIDFSFILYYNLTKEHPRLSTMNEYLFKIIIDLIF